MVNINRSFIWAYNIEDFSLMKEAPFKTKTECAKVLKISRNTVRKYIDTQKVCNYRWVISSKELRVEELYSIWNISSKLLEVIIGELLGDGYIRLGKIKGDGYIRLGKIKGDITQGRLEFTFSTKNIIYLKYLKFNALAFICTRSLPTPWPNPLTGKNQHNIDFLLNIYLF